MRVVNFLSKDPEVSKLHVWALKLFQSVPDFEVLEVEGPAEAGGLISVSHTLRRVPRGVFASPEESAIVWSGPEERALWTADKIYIRSSNAAARIHLLVVA